MVGSEGTRARTRRLISAAGVTLVALLVLTACEPVPLQSRSGTYTTGIITRDGQDTYQLSDEGAGATAVAPRGNSGSNLRTVALKDGAPRSVDQQSCVSFHGPINRVAQPGVALRVRSEPDRTRAITWTNNIWYGARWGFNLHLADSSGANFGERMNGQGGGFLPDAVLAEGGGYLPLPWRFCGRAMGTTVELKVWSEPTTSEPAWGDPSHTLSRQVPESWVYPGRPGWYIGHLSPGERSRLTDGFTSDTAEPAGPSGSDEAALAGAER
ncbi:hypothetical protein BH23ACT2_BH23ACT2_26990 [soil metagenome]